MKTILKITFVIFCLLVFCRCTPRVYTVTGWEIGTIVNPQFAEKVMVIEDYEFETYVKSWLGYSSLLENRKIVGDASDCLVSELRGVLTEYAVIKKAETDNVNPNAEIVKIKPLNVSFKENFLQTGFIASIKVEIQSKGKTETVSAKGDGKSFKESLTNACENIAEKIRKLITEQK